MSTGISLSLSAEYLSLGLKIGLMEVSERSEPLIRAGAKRLADLSVHPQAEVQHKQVAALVGSLRKGLDKLAEASELLEDVDQQTTIQHPVVKGERGPLGLQVNELCTHWHESFKQMGTWSWPKEVGWCVRPSVQR